MSAKLVFPTVLIVLDVFAALVYLWYGDYKHFWYWMSAASITASVTY